MALDSDRKTIGSHESLLLRPPRRPRPRDSSSWLPEPPDSSQRSADSYGFVALVTSAPAGREP